MTAVAVRRRAAEPAAPRRAAAEPSWVARARRGDPDAWARLYAEGREVVYRFVYHRTRGDKSLTEDIVSETFVRALRGAGTFVWTGRNINAWFVTIARNLVADFYKSASSRLEVTMGDMPDEEEGGPSPEDVVLTGITARYRAVELERAMRVLTPHQQTCLNLRFWQGLSVRETAVLMDSTAGAVKTLHYRAIRRLATELDRPRAAMAATGAGAV